MESLAQIGVTARVLLLAILIGFAGTVPVSTQGARGQSTAPVLAQARRALTSGQPALALRLVDPLLAKTPGDKDLASVGIQAAIALDNNSKALTIYDLFVQSSGAPAADVLKPIAVKTLNDVVGTSPNDPRLRAEALERLARDGNAGAAGSLRQDGQAAASRLALIADASLARLGDENATKRIASKISAGDDLPKIAEVEAAARSGKPELAPLLIPLLKHSDPYTRIAAVQGLASLGHKGAVDQMRPLMNDPFLEVRNKTGIALARLGDPAGDAMLATMLRSPVADVKLAAIEAGALSMGPERLVVLRSITIDKEPLNRIRAAELLARDDAEAARAVLIQATQHSDTLVRREAGRVLEGFVPPDLTLARTMMVDSEPWVRMYGAGSVLRANAR